MKIYGLICDGGDGSSGLGWYTKDDADYLMSEDNWDWESYTCNEGLYAVVIEVPKGYGPENLGLRLSRADRD